MVLNFLFLSGGQDGNDLYVQLLLGASLYSELQDGGFCVCVCVFLMNGKG